MVYKLKFIKYGDIDYNTLVHKQDKLEIVEITEEDVKTSFEKGNLLYTLYLYNGFTNQFIVYDNAVAEVIYINTKTINREHYDYINDILNYIKSYERNKIINEII